MTEYPQLMQTVAMQKQARVGHALAGVGMGAGAALMGQHQARVLDRLLKDLERLPKHTAEARRKRRMIMLILSSLAGGAAGAISPALLARLKSRLAAAGSKAGEGIGAGVVRGATRETRSKLRKTLFKRIPGLDFLPSPLSKFSSEQLQELVKLARLQQGTGQPQPQLTPQQQVLLIQEYQRLQKKLKHKRQSLTGSILGSILGAQLGYTALKKAPSGVAIAGTLGSSLAGSMAGSRALGELGGLFGSKK